MKGKKRGRSSTRSKKRGLQKKISRDCLCIPPARGARRKQAGSEQLSFLLEGPSARLLPNIVFSQLDSDLPLVLWWQGEFADPMDPQLWAWVDRVIYDSQGWRDFRAQMERVETAQAEAKQRIVLCDLNWTRLVQIRLALAQFFDHPSTQTRFDEIESVEIEFAPAFRSTALLLAGWLAAQLDWSDGKQDRKSTRLNSSHSQISYAVFCLKKKNKISLDA